MTYKDKTIEEIINDDSYPLKKIFDKVLTRIRSKNVGIIEKVNEDSIVFQRRNMDFAKIIPEEESVRVVVEVPYDRIIDLSNQCNVERFKGRNEIDVVSYDIKNVMDIQYGISLVDQTYNYVVRLKL